MAIQTFEKNLSDLREAEAEVQRLTAMRGLLVEAENTARAENNSAVAALGLAEAAYRQALSEAPGSDIERDAYQALRSAREAASMTGERCEALGAELLRAQRDRPERIPQARAIELRRFLWLQIHERELAKVPATVQEHFARIFASMLMTKVGTPSGSEGVTMSSAIGRCLPEPPKGETLRALQDQLAGEYDLT